MPRDPNRPKPCVVDPIRARVVRGPRADGSYYWRAEVRIAGERSTVWTGWAHPDLIGDQLVQLRQAGAHTSTAELQRQAKRSGASPNNRPRTVRTLLALWLADREAAIVPRVRGELRMPGELLESTFKVYKLRSKHLSRVLGDENTDLFTEDSVQHHVRTRRREGASPSVIAGEYEVLKMAWRWGRRFRTNGIPHPLVGPGDFPRMSFPRRQDKYTPTREEIAAVLEALDGWKRIAFVIMANTGMRIGTVSRLRWRDVDLERAWVVVDGKSAPGKTGERRVKLTDECAEVLRAWKGDHSDRPDAYLCRRRPATVTSLDLKQVCREVGVPEFTNHALRRFAVDQYCRQGVPVEVAAAALGHSVTVMLKHYRQIRDDELSSALERAQLGTTTPELTVIDGGKDESAG